jgi:hypothetical protein
MLAMSETATERMTLRLTVDVVRSLERLVGQNGMTTRNAVASAAILAGLPRIAVADTALAPGGAAGKPLPRKTA